MKLFLLAELLREDEDLDHELLDSRRGSALAVELFLELVDTSAYTAPDLIGQ